jgi:hypothetical protein
MSQDSIYNSSRMLLCKHESLLSEEYNANQHRNSIVNFQKPFLTRNTFIGTTYVMQPINECRIFETRGDNNIQKDYDQTFHKNEKLFLNLTKSRHTLN